MEVLMHEASNGQETNTASSHIYATAKQFGMEKVETETVPVNGGARFMETDPANTVDIIFENITYTVSLGCRKGREPFSILRIFLPLANTDSCGLYRSFPLSTNKRTASVARPAELVRVLH